MELRAEFPNYIEVLIEGLASFQFGDGLRLPVSAAGLDVFAPGLSALVGVRPRSEQEILFRCLGEAEAALLYETCDAIVSGRSLTPDQRRRVFVQSFKERMRRALAAQYAAS